MANIQSILIGAGAGISLAFLLMTTGCDKRKESQPGTQATTTEKAAGLPEQSAEELATPLAKVDDVVITLGEFQERINRQSPYIRARYTSLEQKKEFLDSLVRFEILAKEALRRGFDKDPEVVRTMKQVMIQKLMKDEFENKIKPEDITDQEMTAFYKEHETEYNKPEEVRAAAVVVKDKATAETVAKAAMAEEGAKNKGFRDLVDKFSIDEESKLRGGDLRYFSQDTTEIPKPVVTAAFALQKTGDVAGPIDAGDGRFYVVKLTGRRKAMNKTFDEVKRQIQNRMYRDKRTEAQQSFIDGLKGKASITVFDDALNKVRIDTSASAADSHGHGVPAMMGEGGEEAPEPAAE